MKKIAILGAFILSVLLTSQFSAFAQQTDIVTDAEVSSCTNLTRGMVYGSRDSATGGQVTDLQFFLQQSGYLKSDPTGYFGLATQSAVKAFQKANGITPNGQVGPITRAAIKKASCDGHVTPTPTTGAPTLSFTITPSSGLRFGDPIKVEWSSKNVASCKVFEHGGEDNLPTSGSEMSVARETGTLTISCTGPNGSVTKSVTMYVEEVAVSSVPAVEFIGIPSVSLEYDAAGKESLLVTKGTVRITAGNTDIRLRGNSPVGRLFDPVGNKGTAHVYSTSYGVTMTGGIVGEATIIPKNTSVTFTVRNTAKTSELFAGSYYTKPQVGLLYFDNAGNYFTVPVSDFKNVSTSNSITIIGETSPYITSATTERQTTGLVVKISGVRFAPESIVTIGDYRFNTGSSDTTTLSVPITEGLPAGTYVVQVTTNKGASNKFGLSVESPSVPEKPTIEFISKPTLSLEYDAAGKESLLTTTGTVKISAGSTGINVYAGYIPYMFSLVRSDGTTVDVNSTTLTVEGLSRTENALIPANTSRTFVVRRTVKAAELFAGVYYVKPAQMYYSTMANTQTLITIDPSAFKNASQSNSVTVIGETSPYISGAGSNEDGTITITGARLNLAGNYIQVDGSGNSLVSKFNPSATSVTFDPSAYQLAPGGHTLQITNVVTGNSNKVSVTIKGGTPTVPVFRITSIQAKAASPGELYAGEQAHIYGTGLKGKLHIQIGEKEPKYVAANGTSDEFAEFTVPSYSQSISTAVNITNAFGQTSGWYPLKINVAQHTGGQIGIVFGVYEGIGTSGSGSTHPEQKAYLEIPQSASGKVLVLTAYEPVRWILRNPSNVKPSKIIAVGYYAQQVEGAGSIPLERSSYAENRSYAYAYSAGNVSELTSWLAQKGVNLEAFEGAYSAKDNPIFSQPSTTQVPVKGSYKGYLNGSLFISTASITKEEALENCKKNATNNPSKSIRCTWNDVEIYSTATAGSATTTTVTRDIARTSGFVGYEVSSNTSSVKIGSFAVGVGSNDDRIMSISTDLNVSGTSVTRLSNLTLKVNGVRLGTPIASPSHGINAFTFSSVPISPGATTIIDVYADIGAAITVGTVKTDIALTYRNSTTGAQKTISAQGASITIRGTSPTTVSPAVELGAVTLSKTNATTGDNVVISWTGSQYRAGTTTLVINLVRENGTGGSAVHLPPSTSNFQSGSYTFTVPRSGEVNMVPDLPSFSPREPGRYKVKAIVYEGRPCFGYCAFGTPTPRVIAESTSAAVVTVTASSTPTSPTVQIGQPTLSRSSVAIGQNVTISWTGSQSGSGATTLFLSVVGENGTSGGTVRLFPSTTNFQAGSYTWTVPEHIMRDDMGMSLAPGRYWVKASVYEGNVTCLGFCPPGTNPRMLSQSTSGLFTITAASAATTSPTTSTTGTYKMYLNGTLSGTTASITKADALTNCKTNAANNPGKPFKCTWNDVEIYSVAGTTTSTVGPKKNAMACSRTTLNPLPQGSVACYGIWDSSNEFGDDMNTCYSGSGCTVSTRMCQSGTAVAGNTVSPQNMDLSALTTYAANLGASKEAVKAHILQMWVYTCAGTSSSAPATNSSTYQVPTYTAPTYDGAPSIYNPSSAPTSEGYVYGVSVSGICTDLSSRMLVGSTDQSSNGEVSALQSFLVAQGYMAEVTGYFGMVTENAVKSFQNDKNLIVTGIVGQVTRDTARNLSCAQ